MFDHLEKISQDYPIEDSSMSPISETDAKIIDRLIHILHQLRFKDLVEVLLIWKNKLSDEDVLDLLSKYDPGKKEIRCLEFEGNMLFLSSLYCIQKEDDYDGLRGQRVFNIVINKDPLERSLTSNIRISYDSPKAREKGWVDLKEKLKDFNIKFI